MDIINYDDNTNLNYDDDDESIIKIEENELIHPDKIKLKSGCISKNFGIKRGFLIKPKISHDKKDKNEIIDDTLDLL